MWNLRKITKSINDIIGIYALNEEQMEEDKLGIPVTTLYREMQFPFGFQMMGTVARTDFGRDVVWGRKHNDREYVEKTVLPKLTDLDYLKSLPKNTVGATYFEFIRFHGLDALYSQRFKDSEARPIKGFMGVQDNIRTNLSRHVVITHDVLHTLFKYNTHALGEALIQEVTGELLNYKPSKIIGFFVILAVAKRVKDLKATWKVYKECKENLKKVNKELALYSPLEFLESDIGEIRKKFGISKVPLYDAFEKRYHNHLTPQSCVHIEKWDRYNAWEHMAREESSSNTKTI